MITVYTKPACPQCDQAKALLQSKGVEFKVVHLDVGQARQEGAEYISREDLLKKIPTARMMPQVMDGDVHVGSLGELKQRLAA